MEKFKEFWFDLETTSDNEFVVNQIFLDKPEYETDHHAVEYSCLTQALELLERSRNIIQSAMAMTEKESEMQSDLMDDIEAFKDHIRGER